MSDTPLQSDVLSLAKWARAVTAKGKHAVIFVDGYSVTETAQSLAPYLPDGSSTAGSEDFVLPGNMWVSVRQMPEVVDSRLVSNPKAAVAVLTPPKKGKP